MALKSHPTLFVARHAETPFALDPKRLRGWSLDIGLTAKGRLEAAELGVKLLKLGVTHVVTDDLKRTSLTADYVARALKVEPVHDPGIRPWHAGVLEGQELSLVQSTVKYFVSNPQECVPGGEQYRTFWNRWGDAFYHYLARAKETGERWVIIGHATECLSLPTLVSGGGIPWFTAEDPKPTALYAIDALFPADVKTL